MATIGTVTYPTSTTWEVEVSDLAPGANSFTVSDGTDTATVTVTVRIRLRYGSGAPPLMASSGADYVAAPLLISDGSTYS